MSGPRVAIIDRHPVLCEGLSLRLAELDEFEMVPGATTLTDAEEVIREHSPEIVVLDPGIAVSDNEVSPLLAEEPPRLSDIIDRLRSIPPHPAIVVVAGDAGGADAEEAMRAGVSACLRHDASFEELVSAIHCVERGEMWISPSLLSGLLSGETNRATAPADNCLDELTSREIEILNLLVQGAGIKEVARQLDITVNTARTHTRNIQLKLHVHSSLAAVSVALDKGIRPLATTRWR